MIKNLFEQLYRLIFQPVKAWSELVEAREEKVTDNDSFFNTYLYPVIGIIALLTFVGVFFYEKTFGVQLALRLTIKALIALFAGFFLASFLLSIVMERLFLIKEYKLCQRFVGYASALVYVIYMVSAIFPDYGFLKLALLYTIYMVWEGAPAYMQIPEHERNKFTAITTAIVLLSPFIIENFMYLTMKGMRVE